MGVRKGEAISSLVSGILLLATIFTSIGRVDLSTIAKIKIIDTSNSHEEQIWQPTKENHHAYPMIQQANSTVAQNSDQEESGDASNQSEVTLEASTVSSSPSSSLIITHNSNPFDVSQVFSSATQYSVVLAHDEDEQRLIETNNVTTILSSDKILHEYSDALHNKDLAPARFTDIQSEGSIGGHEFSCVQAYAQCALRAACKPALDKFTEHCSNLVRGETGECSPKCLEAMIALRSSEIGDYLENCDCNSDEFCIQTKRQSQICGELVRHALAPGEVVPCSMASSICLADTSCSTALDYYYINCQSLFTQNYCSAKCNNSLSILNRQPKAAKLINCQCDGSEDFPCKKYKTFTQRLCLKEHATSIYQYYNPPNKARQIATASQNRSPKLGRWLANTCNDATIPVPSYNLLFSLFLVASLVV